MTCFKLVEGSPGTPAITPTAELLRLLSIGLQIVQVQSWEKNQEKSDPLFKQKTSTLQKTNGWIPQNSPMLVFGGVTDLKIKLS